jgi:hypothetical protein
VKPGESKWLNIGFDLRQEAYCKKFKEVKGPDADPYKEPIDPVVAMLAGDGLKNGRLYLGNGSVDTTNTPSLSQLRAASKSGMTAVETRKSPSVAMFQEILVSYWFIHKFL